MARPRFSLAPVAPKEFATLREAQCLVVLLETRGNRSVIAKIMEISHRTVDAHLEELRKKLDCSNQKELIEKGLLCDWVAWREEIRALNPQPAIRGKRSSKYHETIKRNEALKKEAVKKSVQSKPSFADCFLRLHDINKKE